MDAQTPSPVPSPALVAKAAAMVNDPAGAVLRTIRAAEEQGHITRQVRRAAEIIHRKKFMDGRQTPEEVHCALSFPRGAKCKCGRRPWMSIRSMMPVDELFKCDAPFMGRMLMHDPQAFYNMLVQTIYGYCVNIATVYACKTCAPVAERAAARGPSYMLVDIYKPNVDVATNRVVVGPSMFVAEK